MFTNFFQRIIDYLKVDIESSEWPSLKNIIKDDILPKYVRQMAFEFHCNEYFNTTFLDYVEIMNSIEEMGFRIWHNSFNMHCRYTTRLGYHTTGCMSVHYINLNFIAK